MNCFNDTILDEMIQAIVHEVSPEQIILLGSHANGTANKDSDIDLLVVESEPFAKRSRKQEMIRILQALSHFTVSKDILVYSRDEVEYWRSSINHIIARALRDGEVVYERS